MATINMAYDHPQYVVHQNIAMGEGGANVPFARFVAAVACQAYTARYTVTTVGSTTASGTTGLAFVKISGTTTTTVGGYVALSSGNTAFVTSTLVSLSTAAGGLALAAGDILECLPGSDATAKGVVSYEVAVAPLASVQQ
jgi:hypothetical protein